MTVIERISDAPTPSQWLAEQHRGLGPRNECSVCKVEMPCPVLLVVAELDQEQQAHRDDVEFYVSGFKELQRRLVPCSAVATSNAAIQAGRSIVAERLRGPIRR